MARRAVWRSRPDDPRTLVGYALAERGRQLEPAREGLGCLSQLGMVAFFVTGHPFEAIALVTVVSLLPSFRREPRSVEPLLTLPAVATAFPCGVEVTREGTTVGVDRGAVTFLDGWLHFEGFRTTFSLSRSDVASRIQNRLALNEGGGAAFIPDRDSAVEFSTALDGWYRIEQAVQGISILPPLSVHASAHARAWADLAFSGLKASLVVATVVAVWRIWSHSFWFVVFFGGPSALVRSLKELRRLRRFAREDRRALSNETRALESR